jgi:hypothetical protein
MPPHNQYRPPPFRPVMNSPGQHEIIVRCADPPVRRSAGALMRAVMPVRASVPV